MITDELSIISILCFSCSGGGSYLKWGATSRAEGRRIEAPKAPRRVVCGDRVSPSLLGEEAGDGAVPPPPRKFSIFDLQMVCFGAFCGATFKISVTTKSCKNRTLNAWGRRADMTKRNKRMSSFFLTSPTTRSLEIKGWNLETSESWQPYPKVQAGTVHKCVTLIRHRWYWMSPISRFK